MTISLSGLDLSFMKENPLPKKRGRPKKKVDFSAKRSDLALPSLMGDIKPFVNVANPEKTHWISSRSELRSFERSFNCYQTGNDIKPGEIAAKNEAKRAEREKLAAGVDSGWA